MLSLPQVNNRAYLVVDISLKHLSRRMKIQNTNHRYHILPVAEMMGKYIYILSDILICRRCHSYNEAGLFTT